MDPTIEAKLNNFADRCFRDPADRDYVHARLAYRCELPAQFRWSALHCLEKYGKCILLLNRISSDKVGHKFLESLKRIKEAGKFEIRLSKESRGFIERLEKNAADRYTQFSWYTMPGDLERLDRAVAEVRRYCQVLDHEIESGGKTINLFNTYLAHIEVKENEPLRSRPLCGGWLESIMAKPGHPAREALLWDNSFFGIPEENEKATWDYSSSENSPFDLHWEVIDELEKLIFISKEARNEAMKRKASKNGGTPSGRNR